jgi:hypothetical protein
LFIDTLFVLFESRIASHRASKKISPDFSSSAGRMAFESVIAPHANNDRRMKLS